MIALITLIFLAQITVTVQPRTQIWTKGGAITIIVRVERCDCNRKLAVDYEWGSYEIQMEGDEFAIHSRTIPIQSIPPGQWTITATLYRNNEGPHVARTTFTLIGREP